METITLDLDQAILAAFLDYSENGKLIPNNPAIVRDVAGYYYGPALHPHDDVVWDLREGFGTWTPEPGDNLSWLAICAADMVAAEQKRPE